MYEIDALIENTNEMVKESNLDENLKRNIVWNLENMPEEYGFDAGGFEKTETDPNFNYKKMNPYEIGNIVVKEAAKENKDRFIYDWAAFLLNFWGKDLGYFTEENIGNVEKVKKDYLQDIKDLYQQRDFSNYKPLHASLTLYSPNSDELNSWFSEEQQELMKWFNS